MKKCILVLLFCGLAAGAVTAFYPQHSAQIIQQQRLSDLQPGVYKAEYDTLDSHGWKAFFMMEVNEVGEVAAVTFDYYDNAGQLKTQDAGYNKAMRSKNGVNPASYCIRFAKNLQVYQDPEQVDGITGATQSFRGFKELARQAFAAARTGNQATVYLKQPDPPKLKEQP